MDPSSTNRRRRGICWIQVLIRRSVIIFKFFSELVSFIGHNLRLIDVPMQGIFHKLRVWQCKEVLSSRPAQFSIISVYSFVVKLFSSVVFVLPKFTQSSPSLLYFYNDDKFRIFCRNCGTFVSRYWFLLLLRPRSHSKERERIYGHSC